MADKRGRPKTDPESRPTVQTYTPALGDPYVFQPEGFEGIPGKGRDYRNLEPVLLTGKVIYINEAHRYFMVECDCHGVKLRQSFKY